MVLRATGSRHEHKYYFGSAAVSTARNSRPLAIGDGGNERGRKHAAQAASY
jgi:hypothetical protein